MTWLTMGQNGTHVHHGNWPRFFVGQKKSPKRYFTKEKKELLGGSWWLGTHYKLGYNYNPCKLVDKSPKYGYNQTYQLISNYHEPPSK